METFDDPSGLTSLSRFDKVAQVFLQMAVSGDAAAAAAQMRAAFGEAAGQYAEGVARLLAWSLQAGAPPAARFRLSRLEDGLRAAILVTLVPPVIEVTVPAGDACAEAEGLSVIRVNDRTTGGRTARLIPGPNPDKGDLVTWARSGGAPVLASLLATSDPSRVGDLLRIIPREAAVVGIKALAEMPSVPPVTPADAVAATIGWQKSGVDALVRIAETIPQQLAQVLLATVATSEPTLGAEITARVLSWESVPRWDDRGTQRVVKEVDTEALALALKGASEEIRGKFLKNMSHRTGEVLLEEMKYMGPVRTCDVYCAQGHILDVARRLREQGDLIVSGPGGDATIK